jgi:serine/threonine-protein kinase
MLLEEDQVIKETYEVERFLGEGAFAEVYRVKHKFLGRQAMKVLKFPVDSEREAEELLSEAILLSRLAHPNIIRVFDAGLVDTKLGQRPFFTMEYIPGGTLHSFWKSYGAKFVPITDVVEIITQVCRGLSIAHSQQPPIIHRDIKPQNILIGYDALGLRACIADFGLAKSVNPLTLIASAAGTIGFKPPEFLSNIDSCAGDVWAVGCTLYLLLTNKMPFNVSSEADLLSGRCWKQPLKKASFFNPQVDQFLENIISKALALDPKDRYPNAMEMLKDLTKWHPQEIIEKADGEGQIESKDALGSAPKSETTEIKKKISHAFNLAKTGRLKEAADLLEEMVNSHPHLREHYEYQLKLWRRGITM